MNTDTVLQALIVRLALHCTISTFGTWNRIEGVSTNVGVVMAAVAMATLE